MRVSKIISSRTIQLAASLFIFFLASLSVADPASNNSSVKQNSPKENSTKDSVTKVRIISRGDDNAQYAIAMINLALKKAGKPFDIQVASDQLDADKLREELLAGKIDIVWQGTSIEVEEKALPVRICLFKGLLGYRALIIHKDNVNLFKEVSTLEQLQKFTFGQGKGWADAKILAANGLNVVTAAYEGLFNMVDGKRIDAFPRAIHEPWGELTKRPDLDLAVESSLMLVYQLPYYLIVSPSRPELAADLEKGLLMAIDDGSFDNLFMKNAMVKTVIQNASVKERRIIKLKNPMLPPKTPLDNPKLWVDINKF